MPRAGGLSANGSRVFVDVTETIHPDDAKSRAAPTSARWLRDLAADRPGHGRVLHRVGERGASAAAL